MNIKNILIEFSDSDFRRSFDFACYTINSQRYNIQNIAKIFESKELLKKFIVDLMIIHLKNCINSNIDYENENYHEMLSDDLIITFNPDSSWSTGYFKDCYYFLDYSNHSYFKMV